MPPETRRIFIGLMIGMLVASISQTIVGPAMPRIVAELGGMDHYSWVATAAMLVSAISVPIVGKLSDLYGRRGFYLGGLVVFVVGSIVCGLAPNFWTLVAGRAIQGLGMGTVMPLSQTIIGDVIPARQRGKYQGLMGAVFGVTSVAGPLAGGFVTDHWGWRWLFLLSIPVGLIALVPIVRFLHVPHERRDAPIDRWGIVTLTLALVAILLATSWGGTSYPWGSVMIVGLYAAGLALVVAFVLIELRVPEPVLPLRLFRNSIFTWSNIASFAVSMVMFGAIIYIPVHAQGVLGVGATDSGLILVPLMLGLVIMGVLAGLVVTRTGRYKGLMVTGIVLLGGGIWLLTRLTWQSTMTELTLAMVVLGVGLGLAMQQYTLIVQNASARRDLGVATAATQFFRNVGSTVGIAIFGTVLSSGIGEAIGRHLPPGAAGSLPAGGVSAASVLDPKVLGSLPPPVATAVRQGLADQLHEVFLVGLPMVGLALVATLFIRVIPLSNAPHGAEEAGQELLDSMSQSTYAPDELLPTFGVRDSASRTRERILGLQLRVLHAEAGAEGRPLLRRAVSDLGGGDFERGLLLLDRTSLMLTTEDPTIAADAERYACEVAAAAAGKGGLLSVELRRELAALAAEADRDHVLSTQEVRVAERHEAVDLTKVVEAANELGAAFIVDVGRRGG